MPHYLKIDIEGGDGICIRSLENFTVPPSYVSYELDTGALSQMKEDITLLSRLGYTSFQIVNQKDIQNESMPNFLYEYGTSGEFGQWLPQANWKNKKQIIRKCYQLRLWIRLFAYSGILRKTPLQKPLAKILSKITHSTIPSWYDVHAQHTSVQHDLP